MKNVFLLIGVLLCVSQGFSQVGINTTEPAATLDVNGTLRVRDFKSINETQAVKIVGLDEDGNFIEVDVDENVILKDNKLRVVENRYRSAATPIITGSTVHNYDLVILPGEPNDDKKIIRIMTSGGALDFSGIKAGEDGQMIWLMASSNKIKLLDTNPGSDPENQFLIGASIIVKQYGMVQLVYDATIQKWLVMHI